MPGWRSQFVAFCEFQFRVAVSPRVMETGVTDRLLVGEETAIAVTVIFAELFDVPPGPVHDR
jgi:hypothetical protein